MILFFDRGLCSNVFARFENPGFCSKDGFKMFSSKPNLSRIEFNNVKYWPYATTKFWLQQVHIEFFAINRKRFKCFGKNWILLPYQNMKLGFTVFLKLWAKLDLFQNSQSVDNLKVFHSCFTCCGNHLKTFICIVLLWKRFWPSRITR